MNDHALINQSNAYVSHATPVRHRAGTYVTSQNRAWVILADVTARQILDSRGYPTVQVSLRLTDGTVVKAAAPTGGSIGGNEAAERRDGGDSFSGRGVLGAVKAVRGPIADLLLSQGWASLRDVDDALRTLDGTPNYAKLGANAVVAVSMAAARAFAHEADLPLHSWIARTTDSAELLPVPFFNVLNGGVHAPNALAFQEFMIAPVGVATEELAIEAGAEIYHALASRVHDRYDVTGLGDEGGFAVPISRPEEALDLLVAAIGDAGYTPGNDQIAIALDVAANEFSEGNGRYHVAGSTLTRDDLADWYGQLVASYPIRSIEDPFADDDYAGWSRLFDQLGDRVQIVGDDLYVTDAERIRKGRSLEYANAVLIKPNQIGTVSQTFDAIAAAREGQMRCMVAHRSGETIDTFVADLVVGTGAGQLKSGAPARGERVAKYNRLTEIEEHRPELRYGLS